jgi:hypothetical protein
VRIVRNPAWIPPPFILPVALLDTPDERAMQPVFREAVLGQVPGNPPVPFCTCPGNRGRFVQPVAHPKERSRHLYFSCPETLAFRVGAATF